MSADPFDLLARSLHRHLAGPAERHVRARVVKVDPLEVVEEGNGIHLHEDDDDVEVARAVRDLITYDGLGNYTGTLQTDDVVDVRDEDDRYVVSAVIA